MTPVAKAKREKIHSRKMDSAAYEGVAGVLIITVSRTVAFILALFVFTAPAGAWHDETHLAIAKAAGDEKWFNAAGADMAKIKAGSREKRNHFVNNSAGKVITADMVLAQAKRYNSSLDFKGHLYGAIVASIREYKTTTLEGKYARYHLAFCAHYVGDLSQPLHNTRYNDYNRRNHTRTDNVINDEVLNHLPLIEVYPIEIESEENLAAEIARIANLSMKLGYQLEKEGRILSRQEAYKQIGHSVSLLKAIFKWLGK